MYYTLYKDKQSLWRWNLKSANHKTIADSAECYVNKTDAINGISLVKGSSSAPIYEGATA